MLAPAPCQPLEGWPPAGMSPDDMLLRIAEVQYVCRYAARQSHGRQFATSPSRLASSSCF